MQKKRKKTNKSSNVCMTVHILNKTCSFGRRLSRPNGVKGALKPLPNCHDLFVADFTSCTKLNWVFHSRVASFRTQASARASGSPRFVLFYPFSYCYANCPPMIGPLMVCSDYLLSQILVGVTGPGTLDDFMITGGLQRLSLPLRRVSLTDSFCRRQVTQHNRLQLATTCILKWG